MKLISMVDFNTEQIELFDTIEILDWRIFLKRIRNYTEFLKQPLTLGMFVPCDKEGNVLEKPRAYSNFTSYNKGVLKENHPKVYKECEQYQEAKERVLFEGISKSEFDNAEHQKFKTVEDLLNFSFGLTLTDSAIKQIGL